MSQWFFVYQGKAKGPVTTDAIRKAIKKGELGPLDLVYRDGEPKWYAIGEFREFQSVTEQKGSSKPKDLWVVLVAKPKSKGGGFTQKGPFPVDDVLRRIQAGELQYSDFAWKEGMKEWYKIATLEDFNVSRKTKMPKEEVKEPDLPPLPEETMGSSVQEIYVQTEKENERIKKKLKAVEEKNKKPEEVQGPDLVDQHKKGEKTVTAVKPRKKTKKKIFNENNDIEEVPVVIARQRLTPNPSMLRGAYHFVMDHLKKRWVLRVVMGSAILVFASVTLFVSSYFDLDKKLKSLPKLIQSEKKTTPPQLKKIKKVGAVKKPPVKKKPEPKIKPSYLKVVTKGLKGKSPILKILSDGSSHYTVELLLKANGGALLNKKSYYKKLVFKTKKRQLNLSKLRLAKGSYEAVVKIGELKRRHKFFLGVKNKKFIDGLWRYKKRIAFFHQEERNKLILLATRLERLAIDFNQSARRLSTNKTMWKGFWAQWSRKNRKLTSKELTTVGPKSAFKYVHPEVWIRMRALKKELSIEARSFFANPAQSRVVLTDIQNRISALKLDCIKATLWP